MNYQLLNILLVEDDEVEAESLSTVLKSYGHGVTVCHDGDKGFEAFCNGHYDFCIFDLMLPGIDGFTLTGKVRKKDAWIPIVIISRRSHKDDKQKAFELGIDDYLVKPFESDELIWRTGAIARRMQPGKHYNSPGESVVKLGCFAFDFQKQLLKNADKNIRLTRRECEVLKILCHRKDQMVRREEILMQLWGDVDYFHGRSLDVFISKLRRYLKSDETLRIENIPTVGYILKEEKS